MMTLRELRALPAQMPMPAQAATDYERRVLQWSREIDPSVVAAFDLPFGDDEALRYDVFASRGIVDQGRVAPIVVFWHGGGWTNGYKEYVTFMAKAVTEAGLVLVAPGYRLAPQHRMPACCDDALSLLQALRASAAGWGGDATQIYLSGHSAGGHLAALTALRRSALERAGVDPQTIRGCLPVSGIFDLRHVAPPPGSLEERVYSMVLRDPLDDIVLSPLYWTAGNVVPFHMTCGGLDSERVLRSNQQMARLLGVQPCHSSLDIRSGIDHFATHTDLREPASGWLAALKLMVTGRYSGAGSA